jgi:heptosyltransferase-2
MAEGREIVKPRLLVVQLWQLGDLVIATPFLRAACEKYSVTLLAKPFAHDLRARLWPEVNVIQFTAPWTAFEGKYRLWKWPWFQFLRLLRQLARERFEFGLSARWDPRDHLLLNFARVKDRLGFPRLGSQIFLTRAIQRPEPRFHQYEYWRVMGKAIGLDLPSRERLALLRNRPEGSILVHTGAGQPVRVWPLERYQCIVRRLREKGFSVTIACDPDQRNWWLDAGEANVQTPQTVHDLISLIDQMALLIGNDSGPGHLAAFCGVPSFTLFGPQLPEWFAPLHPSSEWMEGKACPYKPCSDYCRFDKPVCMTNNTEEEVWQRIQTFVHGAMARAGQPAAV